MDDAAVVSRIVHESYERSAPLVTEGHWWEHLDEDFARTPEKFDLEKIPLPETEKKPAGGEAPKKKPQTKIEGAIAPAKKDYPENPGIHLEKC